MTPQRAPGVALVTGARGFLGRQVAAALSSRGWRVVCGSRSTRAGSDPGWVTIDSTERPPIDAIAALKPSAVVHCAGVMGQAVADVGALFQGNVVATENLLAAFPAAGVRSTIVIAGSSAVYGRPVALPIDESHPVRPLTAYAVSKAAQELAGLRFQRIGALEVAVARIFNVAGAGQRSGFVAADLAAEISAAERRGDGRVMLGNLEPRRDFLDVRDAAAALAALVESGRAGEIYNVCSGRSLSVRECVSAMTRRTAVPIHVESSPSRVRDTDVMDHIGSNAKLRADTGWSPVRPIEDTFEEQLCEARRAAGDER